MEDKSWNCFLGDIGGIVMKKILKIVGATVFCIINATVFLDIIGLVILFGLDILYSNYSFAKVNSNIEDYGMFRDNGCLREFTWIIFPENLEKVQEVKDYKYLYENFAGTEYQIYLDAVYDSENFEDERERLRNFEYPIRNGYAAKLQFDEAQLFNYPTYIAVYSGGVYSYASIIEEEQRIVYLYIYSLNAEIVAPEEFLPKDFSRSRGEDKDYTYHIASEIENGYDEWYEEWIKNNQ